MSRRTIGVYKKVLVKKDLAEVDFVKAQFHEAPF